MMCCVRASSVLDIYNDEEELRLDERQLAEQLGISRTPIREALARLAQDGLVEILPRKGVFIHRKSLDEILGHGDCDLGRAWRVWLRI